MNLEKVLDELLRQKIGIMDSETEEHIDDSTVDGISEGFDLYIDLNNEKAAICLYDFQDDEYEWELGTTVKECLSELSSFEEYFNAANDGWVSDFFYYYEEMEEV